MLVDAVLSLNGSMMSWFDKTAVGDGEFLGAAAPAVMRFVDY